MHGIVLLMVFCLAFGATFSQDCWSADLPAVAQKLPAGAVVHLPSQTSVYDVQFSPTGRLLATRDQDQTIHVWDVPTGRHRYALTGHEDRVSSLAFSPDERHLVTGSTGVAESVRIWDLATGELVRKLSSQPSRLAFDKDGGLFSAARTGVEIFAVPSGDRRRGSAQVFPKRVTEVLAIAPQNDVLAYVVSSQLQREVPHEVFVSKLSNGRILHHQSSPDSPAAVVLAPNGEHAAICFRRSTDGVLLTSLTAEIDVFTLPGHSEKTLVAGFSHDSRILATGSWDGKVRLWDVLTGSQLATLPAVSGHVLALGLSPNGNWIVTSGSSTGPQGVLVWDLRRLVYGTLADDASPLPATLIQKLGSRDVHDAYSAMRRLHSMGDSGLETVRSFLLPLVSQLTDAEVEKLIEELNSNSFQVRESANQTLLRVRRLAAERLQNALLNAPTLEVELRLRKLLSANEKASLVSESRYRQLFRIVQFLEVSPRSQQARDLLSRLVIGHADSRVSMMAEQALKRMTVTSNDGLGA